ncbi:MAG: hypothetical protein JHD35_00570 [Sphingopyxis sp.]|nr:hypothetical protein [Sphingopyxis sp.]
MAPKKSRDQFLAVFCTHMWERQVSGSRPADGYDYYPNIRTTEHVLALPYNYRSARVAIRAMRPKESSSFQETRDLHLTPVRFLSDGRLFS